MQNRKVSKSSCSASSCSPLIVGGGVVAAPHLTQNLPINNPKQPAGDTAEAEPPVVGETSSIVQVVKPLIPGDVGYGRRSTGSLLSVRKPTIRSPCKELTYTLGSAMRTLVGMYVQEYIPAGQYVSLRKCWCCIRCPQVSLETGFLH